MDHTPEWRMVIELMEYINEIDSDNASDFVENLYKNLEPHTPFEEQIEGDVEKQRTWLNSLFQRYVNGDLEAAQEAWEE